MKQTSTVGTICLIFVKTKRGREAEDDDDKKGTRTTKQYRQASKQACINNNEEKHSVASFVPHL